VASAGGRRDGMTRAVAPAGTVVLVEAALSRPAGHWTRYVHDLARAADGEGLPLVVVCDGPVRGRLAEGLAAWRVRVLQRCGHTRLRPLHVVARTLDLAFRAAHRARPRSPYAYQLLILARCLAEADDLRRARRAAPQAGAVVLVTAGEALAGLVRLLSGVPHVRVVHDTYSWHSPLIRALERVLRPRLRSVVVVCPTGGVASRLTGRDPGLPITVRPFALAGPAPGNRPRPVQSSGDPRGITVGIFGSWHRWKDHRTVRDGILRCRELTTDVSFLIAGADVPWAGDLPAGDRRVRVIEAALEEHELAALYEQCDASVVCRRPGVDKESGLVADAARFGVHLVCSDHDRHLTAVLRGEPWVTLFEVGKPESLARALVSLTGTARPPRPDPAAQVRLGLHGPADTLEFYRRLHARARLGVLVPGIGEPATTLPGTDGIRREAADIEPPPASRR
jgi:glycosyltransferase involved in cell wall biosynthesis